MQVRLRIATNFPGTGSERDHTLGEHHTIIGTGDDYETAKADADRQVPDGALKLHYIAER